GTPVFRLLATVGANFDVGQSGGASAASNADHASGAGKTQGSTQKTDQQKSASSAPSLDKDGDNVPDAEDVCPDIIGDASPSAQRRGCPPDRDRDTIA